MLLEVENQPLPLFPEVLLDAAHSGEQVVEFARKWIMVRLDQPTVPLTQTHKIYRLFTPCSALARGLCQLFAQSPRRFIFIQLINCLQLDFLHDRTNLFSQLVEIEHEDL